MTLRHNSGCRVFIFGFVQGVGFRQFIKKNAISLGLSGWVRNRSDGRVEAVFAGDREKTKEMISLCRKGPFLAEVKWLDVKWEDVKEEFGGFEIIM